MKIDITLDRTQFQTDEKETKVEFEPKISTISTSTDLFYKQKRIYAYTEVRYGEKKLPKSTKDYRKATFYNN